MKTKKSIITRASKRLLSIAPVLILVIFVIFSCAGGKKVTKSQTKIGSSSPDTQTNQEETPFVVVEEMPMFPGGDSTLLAYISQNTKYPETAKNSKIQGRVIVRFCVTSVGGVDRISILRGVSPELDSEAIRVVSTLPAFSPGRQGGKPVPVWFMVPITFSLK